MHRDNITILRLFAVALGTLLLVFLAIGCTEESEPVTPPPPPSAPDTTSHDFVWEFDTLAGQYSFINAVAAISPTDIWVTGKFFLRDSLGKSDGIPDGNAAHWNGKEWTYHGFNSLGIESWHELDDAYCRGPNNIWICGGGPFQWDGAKWTTHNYTYGQTFGSGILEVYSTEHADYVGVVGLNQSLAYYRKDDGKFTKIYIPEKVDCLDITGLEDGTMYVAAGGEGNGYIYKVTPDRKVAIEHIIRGRQPRAIWLKDGKLHYCIRGEIYRLEKPYDQYVDRLVYTAEHSINEQDHEQENNMYFALIPEGMFLHWNGSTWKTVRIPYPSQLHTLDLDVCGKDIYFTAVVPGQFCVLAHGRQL